VWVPWSCRWSGRVRPVPPGRCRPGLPQHTPGWRGGGPRPPVPHGIPVPAAEGGAATGGWAGHHSRPHSKEAPWHAAGGGSFLFPYVCVCLCICVHIRVRARASGCMCLCMLVCGACYVWVCVGVGVCACGCVRVHVWLHGRLSALCAVGVAMPPHVVACPFESQFTKCVSGAWYTCTWGREGWVGMCEGDAFGISSPPPPHP
jgi:hypothetical protein